MLFQVLLVLNRCIIMKTYMSNNIRMAPLYNKKDVNYLIIICIVILADNFNLQAQMFVDSNIYVKENTLLTLNTDLHVKSNGLVDNNGKIISSKDVDNEGTLTYSALNGVDGLHLVGSHQVFSGNGKNKIYNLFIDNNGVDLFSNVEINNELHFENGKINDEDGGMVIFNQYGLCSGTSNSKYIKVKAACQGKENFQFPLGKNGVYRNLNIYNSNVESKVTATYFCENSDVDYPHTNKPDTINFIEEKEFWEVESSTPNNFIVEISRNSKTSSSDILQAAGKDITIMRWDEEDRAWIDEGGLFNSENNSIKTISNVKGNGVFTLAVKRGDENVIVYNAITPNNDGINDFLLIKGIETYPKNQLEIYNRWGRLVWKGKNYNNKDNLFNGKNNVGAIYGNGDFLPSGTYYYVLKYKNDRKNNEEKIINYLYINKGE